MKLRHQVLPVAYGLATYTAMAFVVSPVLGRVVYFFFPKSDEAFGTIAAILYWFLVEVFIFAFVAPFLSGFVTARAAKHRPYFHSFYAALVISTLWFFLHYSPWFSQSVLPSSRVDYGIIWTIGLLLGFAGTWIGAQRAERQAEVELRSSLQDPD